MPTHYRYELWNGREVVGYYTTPYAILGTHISIPTISELKRIYGRNYEDIKIPIGVRLVSNDGINYTYRTYLDVRRKSKRQIDLIKDK